MKSVVKYSLITLVLLIVAMLALPFFIDVNEYRPMIVEQIEEATGRDVDIGEIQASVFPWVGISLSNVRMGNAKGFSDREFAKVDSVDIQIALMPLLNREVIVKRFILDSPQLLLERDSQGKFNWEDLTTRKSAAVESPPVSPSEPVAVSDDNFKLASLTAESLNLRDAEIVWNDAMSKTSLNITELNVEVKDVQLERPISLEVSARVEGEMIRLNGQVGPVPDFEKLDPATLPLQMQLKSDALSLARFKAYFPESAAAYTNAHLGLNITVEQRSDQMRLSAGNIALSGAQEIGLSWKVQMPKASSMDITEMIVNLDGQELLKANGNLRGIGGKLRYQLNVSSADIKREMVSSRLPVVAEMYAQHPNPWNQIKLQMSAAGSLKQAELKNVQLMLDDELVQISGAIKLGGAPNLQLRVAANSLHLDPWLPTPAKANDVAAPAKPTVQQTSSQRSSSQEPDLRYLKDWKLSAELKVDKFFIRGLELDNLTVVTESNKGVLVVDPFRFDYGKGNVRNKTRLEVKNYPVTWSASTNLTRIQVNPLLKTFADTSILHGALETSSQLSGVGIVEPNLTANLNGSGNIALTDGKIEGIDIPGAIRRASSLGMGSKAGNKATDFSQLVGSFAIRNGVARNDDLYMASPVFRLTGNGIINLANKTLDYHAKPKLVGTLVGQGDTEAARKGLAVPIHVTGPFSAPKISLDVDLKSLMQNPEAIKGTVRGAKKMLKDLKQPPAGGTGGTKEVIKKGLGGLLKGL